MEQQLIPHLFRTEYRKLASVLCKHFGIEHIEVAEDIAAETFLAALESWPYKGIPPNPVAWLHAVAKNKARNYQHKSQTYLLKVAPNIKRDLDGIVPELDLSEQNITDSQLQMLFALCHPSISMESQIGLSLRILCGFGIEEIANGFLTSKDVINKRLFRAKEKLREVGVAVEMPDEAAITQRLEPVLTTLYLVFNEGYYSESSNTIIREDFCLAAMQLVKLLLDNDRTNLPEVNALYALMCFHASRFKARKGQNGEMILYADQDESLWDMELISQGAYYLNKASSGSKLSKYHLEASIAYWHTKKEDTQDKWESILQLYNKLLMIAYSPIAALNRTYALSKVRGVALAIVEAEKLQLTDNHFYHLLLAELYWLTNRNQALAHLKTALPLVKTRLERELVMKKIQLLSLTN
ncbi:MAG TPA: sigma factor [Cyclobacteriaceae bacterium]|nr:sigma factor [Cyclobacteriaceae bacterium]